MQQGGEEEDTKTEDDDEDDEEIHKVKFKRSISKSINEFVKSKHERRKSNSTSSNSNRKCK